MARTSPDLPGSATGVPLDPSRRAFLSASLAAGGGLMLTVSLPAIAEAGLQSRDTRAPVTQLSAYILIARDGRVTIMARSPDMGQGIKTTLPMIIADELDVAWMSVRVETAAVNPALYGMQFSYGSLNTPIAIRSDAARGRGRAPDDADSRSSPVAGAGQRMRDRARASCITARSGRQASYGALASRAAHAAAAGSAQRAAQGSEGLQDHRPLHAAGGRPACAGRASRCSASTRACRACCTRCTRRRRCLAVARSARTWMPIKAQPGVRDAFIIHGDPADALQRGSGRRRGDRRGSLAPGEQGAGHAAGAVGASPTRAAEHCRISIEQAAALADEAPAADLASRRRCRIRPSTAQPRSSRLPTPTLSWRTRRSSR